MKSCCHCKIEKPLSEFRRTNDGRPAYRCRPCADEYARNYYREKVLPNAEDRKIRQAIKLLRRHYEFDLTKKAQV